MGDLPLEIAQVDPVAVEQADRAEAGGGQIQGRRRAEPPDADNQHARSQQLLLAGPPNRFEPDVPSISVAL